MMMLHGIIASPKSMISSLPCLPRHDQEILHNFNSAAGSIYFIFFKIGSNIQ